MNVAEFVPMPKPFTFHWKVGVAPPLIGKPAKVTGLPAQTLPAGVALMVILTGMGSTVMITAFEVAGLPIPQVSCEVMTQVIVSPWDGK